MTVLKEYDTKLDTKNRFTLRKAQFEHFHVTEYEDGHIELRPRVLVDPNMISRNTLGMMDQAMDNFKKGKVSAPIDLSEFDEGLILQFEIRMGVPEMELFWNDLVSKYRSGTLSMDEGQLFKKLTKALKYLSQNPRHTGLNSHDIDPLSRRYGVKVWESYLENNKPAAGRIFWVYGPEKKQITIIGIEPHPEDKKKGGYDKVDLSSLPD